MSLIVPAIFLLIGGIPLPGGANYVREDLLRGRGWLVAVSLAGPAMNLLLFFACLLPLHPAFGWVTTADVERWTLAQRFFAASAVLQGFSVFLNLVPVPPLDGFRAISPFLAPEVHWKLTTPPWSIGLFVGFFLVLWNVPQIMNAVLGLMLRAMMAMGFSPAGGVAVVQAFGSAF
jgi:Zn-dependent protease